MGKEIKRSTTIQKAVEAYMRLNLMRNHSPINDSAKLGHSYVSIIPEPSLSTWKMVREVVQMLLDGQTTWEQIRDNFKGQEANQREIELFCELSSLQKRVVICFLSFIIS